MLSPVVLGLDLGTSGLKAVALDAAGRTVAECTHGYPLSTPRPGWTEQSPADWVNAAAAALKEISDHARKQECCQKGYEQSPSEASCCG